MKSSENEIEKCSALIFKLPLTSTQKMALIYLLGKHDLDSNGNLDFKRGVSGVTRLNLATSIGRAESSLKDVLRALKTGGWIKTHEIFAEGTNQQQANRYVFSPKIFSPKETKVGQDND